MYESQMFIYEIYILYSTCKPQSLFKCILQNANIVYTGKWFESDKMFIDIYTENLVFF